MDDLLAALTTLDLFYENLIPNSSASTPSTAPSVKTILMANMPVPDALHAAIKLVASSFDQLHLLTDEEVARYKKCIFKAQQDHQNLLAESHKKVGR